MMNPDSNFQHSINQIILFATHLCSFFLLLFILEEIMSSKNQIKKYPRIDLKEFT